MSRILDCGPKFDFHISNRSSFYKTLVRIPANLVSHHYGCLVFSRSNSICIVVHILRKGHFIYLSSHSVETYFSSTSRHLLANLLWLHIQVHYPENSLSNILVHNFYKPPLRNFYMHSPKNSICTFDAHSITFHPYECHKISIKAPFINRRINAKCIDRNFRAYGCFTIYQMSNAEDIAALYMAGAIVGHGHSRISYYNLVYSMP